MDEFAQFISNVGFPITAFVMMFYMCNTTLKENTKAVTECTELLKEIIDRGKEDANV